MIGRLVIPEQAMASRVESTTHNFFTPPPVSADVDLPQLVGRVRYQNLSILVPILKPGERVLLNEGVLPEPGSVGGIEERNIRTMDLMQFVTFDGREREMAHWDSLFERMDEAFESVKALKPEKTHRWLIEAV